MATDLVAVPDRLVELADRQAGVAARRQLAESGLGQCHIRAAADARRWRTIGRNVVVLHNGELTGAQRMWVAVLLPGKPAALAGLTAARACGMRGFEEEQVHVVLRHATGTALPSWVKVHESRRFSPDDIVTTGGPPRVRIERALVDAAAWSTFPRRACALLCAGVQQRLTTAGRLERELRMAGHVRHVAIMRSILGDIAGGGHTLAEIDLAPLAARAGLGPPTRQVLRKEASGKVRWLDATFVLPDGSTLVVEIDGAVHLQPLSYWDDMNRQNEIVIGKQPILRFGSATVRLEGHMVVDQLRRIRSAYS